MVLKLLILKNISVHTFLLLSSINPIPVKFSSLTHRQNYYPTELTPMSSYHSLHNMSSMPIPPSYTHQCPHTRQTGKPHNKTKMNEWSSRHIPISVSKNKPTTTITNDCSAFRQISLFSLYNMMYNVHDVQLHKPLGVHVQYHMGTPPVDL